MLILHLVYAPKILARSVRYFWCSPLVSVGQCVCVQLPEARSSIDSIIYTISRALAADVFWVRVFLLVGRDVDAVPRTMCKRHAVCGAGADACVRCSPPTSHTHTLTLNGSADRRPAAAANARNTCQSFYICEFHSQATAHATARREWH